MVTEITHRSPKKIAFAWTSDASGDATETTSGYYSGKIVHVVTDPDGTAAPTDNYDITLTDSDGVDLLAGNGANRDTATTEHILSANLGIVVESQLKLTVANAGNAKEGVVYVYIQ